MSSRRSYGASPEGESDGLLDVGPSATNTKRGEHAPWPSTSIIQTVFDRSKWLIGLLLIQSCSQFILVAYSNLVRAHFSMTRFLIVLIATGGAASVQSATRVIREIATGELTGTFSCIRQQVTREVTVGFWLSLVMSAACFCVVFLTAGENYGDGAVESATAISSSLFLIMCTSTFLGSLLPFALLKLGFDPVHASSAIAIIMDVVGVTITCATCSVIFGIFGRT